MVRCAIWKFIERAFRGTLILGTYIYSKTSSGHFTVVSTIIVDTLYSLFILVIMVRTAYAGMI